MAKNAPHPGLSPMGRGAGRNGKFLAPEGRGKVRGKSLHLCGLAVMANYV